MSQFKKPDKETKTNSLRRIEKRNEDKEMKKQNLFGGNKIANVKTSVFDEIQSVRKPILQKYLRKEMKENLRKK